MDPLSDILSLLKPRSFMFRGIDAAGRWSLRFPSVDGVRCYVVLSGACWLVVDGADDAMRLQAGDCVLLTQGQTFRLASDPALPPEDVLPRLTGAGQGGVAIVHGGGEVAGIGGYFSFAGRQARALLAFLPPLLRIEKESDKSALRASMDMLMQELREPQPGAALVAEHLGQLLLALALRTQLQHGPQAGTGWLAALADRQLGQALAAMHAAPGRHWTLQSLAARASMSRATFALRFKQVVGESPLHYLTRWRMLLAGERLGNSDESIAAIAEAVGYASESAFSAAFKRLMNCSPREYARSMRPEAPPGDGRGRTS